MSEYTIFHQQEALTTRLANILEEYPAGPSSLREFVQNADDAHASSLVLCLDAGCSEAAEMALPCEELRALNGPALLVWNDAKFTEADFVSISSIGRSRKREDATTIGRYGLGFNVSYHFSDVVQLLSADSLVFFDPHGTSLPGKELGLRAKLADGFFARYPGVMEPLLQPLRALTEHMQSAPINVTGAEGLDCTLFRLPLRTAAQASSSLLSSHAVEPLSVLELLRDVGRTLPELLLFTQHLCRMCVRSSRTRTRQRPAALSAVSLESRRCFSQSACVRCSRPQ